MKNESTALARLREIKRREKRERERERERERADTDLELSFSFSVVVQTRACSFVLSSQLRNGCETSSQELTQNGHRNFRPSSHRRG